MKDGDQESSLSGGDIWGDGWKEKARSGVMGLAGPPAAAHLGPLICQQPSSSLSWGARPSSTREH